MSKHFGLKTEFTQGLLNDAGIRLFPSVHEIDRSIALTGDITLSMGDGNDSLGAAHLKNGDSMDIGAGDDSIGLYATNSSGTPSYTSLNLTKLDGGTGTDTLFLAIWVLKEALNSRLREVVLQILRTLMAVVETILLEVIRVPT